MKMKIQKNRTAIFKFFLSIDLKEQTKVNPAAIP
jgi:hypothetical protein